MLSRLTEESSSSSALSSKIRNFILRQHEIRNMDSIMPSVQMFMKRHYLLPNDNESSCRFYFRACLSLMALGVIGIVFLLYSLEMFMKGSEVDFMEELAFSAEICAAIISSIYAVRNRHLSLRIIRNLLNFEKFGKPPLLTVSEFKIKCLSYFLYYGGIMTCFTWFIGLLIERNACIEYNEDHNIEKVCGILGPLSNLHLELPFRKQIYFLLQLLVFLWVFPCSTQMTVIVYGFQQHIITRNRHLRSMLQSSTKNKKLSRSTLKIFVEYHQQILRLMKDINQITSIPLCVFLFVYPTMLTFMVYQLFNLRGNSFLGPLMNMSVNIFLLFVVCTTAEDVVEESYNVYREIYCNTLWYDFETPIQKDLLLIIVIAQKRPMAMNLGSFGYLSHHTFIKVTKGLYLLAVGLFFQKLEAKSLKY